MEFAWIPGIVFRLLVPLLIIPFPLAGGLLAMVADTIDVVIWDLSGVTDIGAHYNLVDKLLDNYMYLFMGVAAWRWKNWRAKNVAIGLLAYRTIGVVLFSLTDLRWLIFFFPDIFSFFYFYYLIHIKLAKKDPFKNFTRLAVVVAILAIPKLYQEYLFHVVEIPLYQIIRPWIEPLLNIF